MKYILYSISIVLLATSCSSLDLNPLSEGSSENWYSDEKEIEMAVAYLYSSERFYNQEFFRDRFTDLHSDDWSWRTDVSELSGGTVNSESALVSDTWQRAYQCISAANRLIVSLESSNGIMGQERIDFYLALARFARATQYAELVFRFGDVPYYDQILSVDEGLNMSRTPKDEILASIYQDYDFATTFLPISYGSSEKKYATRGAALAMKARIALYMHDYPVARDAAKACMDLGIYELEDSFQDIHDVPNSKESIFNFPRSLTLENQLHVRNGLDIVPRNVGGFGSQNPSLELLLSFLCADGLPIDESPLFNPRNPFENRDPRCSFTIVPFGTRWFNFTFQPHPDTLTVMNFNTGERVPNLDSRAVVQWTSFNGLMWRKKVKPNWATTGAVHDNIIIRYADVLMMYAEAKIELNEIDASVLDAMNSVRARAYGVDKANVDSYPEIVETNQASLRRILRIERRMEFAFEGLRYSDLIRWRLAEKALNRPIYGMLDVPELRERVVNKGLWFLGDTPDIDEDGLPDLSSLFEQRLIKQLVPRRFNAPTQYLYPIPANEIIINHNIKQNSGY